MSNEMPDAEEVRKLAAAADYEGWQTLSPSDQLEAVGVIRRTTMGQRRLFSLMQAYEVAQTLKLPSAAMRVIGDAFYLEARALRGTYTPPTPDQIMRRALLGKNSDGDDHDRWVMREHLLVCAWAYHRTARFAAAKRGLDETSASFHIMMELMDTLTPGRTNYIRPPKTYEDVVLLMLSLYGEGHPLSFGSLKPMSMAEATNTARDMAKKNGLNID